MQKLLADLGDVHNKEYLMGTWCRVVLESEDGSIQSAVGDDSDGNLEVTGVRILNAEYETGPDLADRLVAGEAVTITPPDLYVWRPHTLKFKPIPEVQPSLQKFFEFAYHNQGFSWLYLYSKMRNRTDKMVIPPYTWMCHRVDWRAGRYQNYTIWPPTTRIAKIADTTSPDEVECCWDKTSLGEAYARALDVCRELRVGEPCDITTAMFYLLSQDRANTPPDRIMRLARRLVREVKRYVAMPLDDPSDGEDI